jgi:protein-S-isoprenylcysteine O-methyltransferase Ste14
MFRFFVCTTIAIGSIVYFYYYQFWPGQYIAHKTIPIRSDRHFVFLYRFIQVSTPICAILAVIQSPTARSMPAIWFGLGFSVLSIFLFVWSMRALRGNYSPCFRSYVPESLVDEGPYRFLRHPIYVANCMMLVGLFVATGSFVVLFNGAVLAVYYFRAARQEESSLIRHLAGYSGYVKRTGGFFPKITHEPSRQVRA